MARASDSLADVRERSSNFICASRGSEATEYSRTGRPLGSCFAGPAARASRLPAATFRWTIRAVQSVTAITSSRLTQSAIRPSLFHSR